MEAFFWYVSTYWFSFLVIDLCFFLEKLGKASVLLVFFSKQFGKITFKNLLIDLVIFLIILFAGAWVFNCHLMAAVISGFISWIIIAILLADKTRGVI